ncbi:hypothetical protein [Polyangium spumosum]|uniref:DUF1285 domain-containing protein n=1 Tax=Polyangium spumosum TaxID=889282 RepID=A0A6N7PTD2_9BACT|nr:hypothetical protein [Polyangium spumosum]MRG93334.1 hypothetical protein [Polyangium spumosum]
MKPGDHPDFFKLAPPPGTSRESTIVLDREGRFWHDGARVDHPALEEALHRWITRHPEDGRLILTNGYDWCYFRAEVTPFVVRGVRVEDEGQRASLVLSDGTEELLDPRVLSVSSEGVVFARVKAGAEDAVFTRHAQAGLAPLLVSGEPPVVRVGDVAAELKERAAQ